MPDLKIKLDKLLSDVEARSAIAEIQSEGTALCVRNEILSELERTISSLTTSRLPLRKLSHSVEAMAEGNPDSPAARRIEEGAFWPRL